MGYGKGSLETLLAVPELPELAIHRHQQVQVVVTVIHLQWATLVDTPTQYQ
jgi:hypothetical protein